VPFARLAVRLGLSSASRDGGGSLATVLDRQPTIPTLTLPITA
jgi:hypothetical protein